MYFDKRPKADSGSLYGLKKEQRQLRKAIRNKDPLVLITGLRRTGKTSLLQSTLNAGSIHFVLVDLRNLDNKQYVTKKEIQDIFKDAICAFLNKHKNKKAKIARFLRSVRGITLPTGGGISFDFSEAYELDIHGLIRSLDKWAAENNTQIVIAIDEAQEFRKCKHLNMTGFFASLYDYCKNTVLILTGSEVGLVYDFLGIEDPNAPLFGRFINEIRLFPMTRDQGLEFLRLGFKQHKIGSIDDDILKHAVDELGGIAGWLNLFGVTCVHHGTVKKRFINNVKKNGSILARKEFDAFLKTRTVPDTYESIMKILSVSPMEWSQIKKMLMVDTNRNIHNTNFSKLIKTLLNSGFIQKSNSKYSITDPLLRLSFGNYKLARY